MDLRVLSGLLLFGQFTSLILMGIVLRRQNQVSKTTDNPELNGLRRILFGLSAVIFFGNLVPILINILTLTGVVTRSTNHVNLVGVIYSASNTLVAVLSAFLVFMMYRVAERTLLIVEHDKDVALRKK